MPTTGAELTLAQLRRDPVLLWCWLPVGGLALLFVVKGWTAVAGTPPPALFTVLDIGWIAVTFSLIARRSMSCCPKCDHRWLRGFPWMSLKKVECGVCGHQMLE
ncbi:MAG: hypothetical protein H7276_02300 [Caulobacter sp.]|nr:hypothetical protein [Vitreoscilla sp.]